jgi:hypothetical protein
MEDRRVFARIHLKIPVKFLDSTSGIEGMAETIDISANGVGIVTFVSKENLAVNTKLEIWLNIPDHHAPFYTFGEVVWSQFLSDGVLQRVGICLNNIDFIGLARALQNKKLDT